MGRLLTVLLLAGLVVPSLASPLALRLEEEQAATPQAPASAHVSDERDADARFLIFFARTEDVYTDRMIVLDDAGDVSTKHVFAFDTAAEEAPSTKSVLRVRSDEPVRSLASAPVDEHVAEAGFAAVVAAAQQTVAALGAASASASGVGPLNLGPSAPPGTARHADDSAASPPAWVVAAVWSVVLASLGILLGPRLLPAGLWGLYARLTRNEMENHPRRALLVQLIQQEPGIHIASLQRRTGLGGGVLRHHLTQLEDHGLVRHLRVGRMTQWSLATAPRATVPRPSPAGRRVLDVVAAQPDLSTPQLARRLVMSVQGAWKHLVALRDAGWVTDVARGRRRHWRPLPA